MPKKGDILYFLSMFNFDEFVLLIFISQSVANAFFQMSFWSRQSKCYCFKFIINISLFVPNKKKNRNNILQNLLDFYLTMQKSSKL